MKRGVAKFTPQELKSLIGALDWEQVPQTLSNRLKIKPTNNIDTVGIFLSEEDVEVILDAADPKKLSEEDSVKHVHVKLQRFLLSLRNK